MKSFLRRAWKEILQGENLDVYLMIVLAIGLGVINLLGVIPSQWMNTWVVSIILTVLGLLAVVSLGNRHRIDGLTEKLSKDIADIFVNKWESDGAKEMLVASEIWFVGVSLGGPIGDHYALLESKLKSGAKIKFLFRNPDGPNLNLVTEQEYTPNSPEHVKQNIQRSLARASALQKISPANMEIRIIDYPIPYNLFANDPDSPSGILYLEMRSYKMPEGDIPKITLYPKDGYWYEFFKRQLFIFWENAKIWDTQKNSKK